MNYDNFREAVVEKAQSLNFCIAMIQYSIVLHVLSSVKLLLCKDQFALKCKTIVSLDSSIPLAPVMASNGGPASMVC